MAVSHIRRIVASLFPCNSLLTPTHTCTVLCTTHTVHAHWAEVMSWDGSCSVIQWGKSGRESIPHSCTSSHPYRRTTIRGHAKLAAVIKCDVVEPQDTLGVKMRSSRAYMSQRIMRNVIHWATYCNVLLLQHYLSADLKIKKHFYIYALLIFSI